MTEEYIKYGNELIGKFLGWELVCLNKDEVLDEDEFYVYEFHKFDHNKEVVSINCGGDSWSWMKGDTIPYNDNWNYLMSAVEQICEIDNCADLEFAQELFAADLDILKNTSIMCHKGEVYERVIKFIEWYNKRNNELNQL